MITPCEMARCDTEGILRVSHCVKQVVLIAAENNYLQGGLMVCTHLGGRCDRGTASTLHVGLPFYVWDSNEMDMKRFAWQCIFVRSVRIARQERLSCVR